MKRFRWKDPKDLVKSREEAFYPSKMKRLWWIFSKDFINIFSRSPQDPSKSPQNQHFAIKNFMNTCRSPTVRFGAILGLPGPCVILGSILVKIWTVAFQKKFLKSKCIKHTHFTFLKWSDFDEKIQKILSRAEKKHFILLKWSDFDEYFQKILSTFFQDLLKIPQKVLKISILPSKISWTHVEAQRCDLGRFCAHLGLGAVLNLSRLS